MANLGDLEQRIGVEFRQPELLRQAMVHRSYLNENPGFELASNERLEFLGDAVLAYVSAAYLYRTFPDRQEGQLTALRAAAVRAETLAKFARDLALGTFLLLGRGEDKSGGRSRSLLLSSVFEAVVGAILIDRGLDDAAAFIERFLAPEINVILAEGSHQNFKSRLQEWSQARRQLTPTYRTASDSGPGHDRRFNVEVLLGQEVVGRGTGSGKQGAQQAAAKDALERLEGLVG
ncbi:MAG: ribonuclease III [Chloroflexota bacterium]